jgi:hypothetical protein
MARSAIPDFGVEYPEYERRQWPKYVGLDADGEALIAKDEAQFEELKELAVYPKVLGKDRHGNEVVAQNPRDEQWFKAKVVHAAIEEAEPVNALTDKPRHGGRKAAA